MTSPATFHHFFTTDSHVAARTSTWRPPGPRPKPVPWSGSGELGFERDVNGRLVSRGRDTEATSSLSVASASQAEHREITI